MLRRDRAGIVAVPINPVDAADRIARGGAFNRASVAALALAGVEFQAGLQSAPNLVVNAQGTVGLLTNRVGVRFVTSPTAGQRTALRRRGAILGDPRFGTQTVFIVETPDPMGFADALRADSIDFVDVEVDVLYPLRRPQLVFPQAGNRVDYFSIIGRDPMLSGEGATIGVIDGGFQDDHPSLTEAWDRRSARIVTFDSGTSTVSVTTGIGPPGGSSHGTSVTSVAAGSVVEEPGAPGVAAGAYMIPLSLTGASSSALFAIAIEVLVNLRVGTIVSSVHLPTMNNESPVLLQAACDFAEAQHQVVVWAALEEIAPRRDHWIGKYPTVVLIGGLKNNLTRRDGTTEVDAVAPGTDIVVAVDGSVYELGSGHSLAAPIVGAAIALTKRVYPNATAAQLRAMLAGACCPSVESGAGYGSGIVNIRRLLEGTAQACPI